MTVPRRLADGTLGDWINERLLGHSTLGTRVGSVVPTGFARVVRVLHPAGGGRSWADVARANGKVVHPLVQWGSIAPDFDDSGRSDVDPEEGSVPAPTLEAILEHCPADGDVIYAAWDGWGSWTDRYDKTALIPGWGGRSYRLFTCGKSPVTHWPGMDDFWPQSASLIWPRHESWCIATEIDFDSTLVACSEEVAAALLADERLEAFEVRYGDDLSWHGDTVNPQPQWLR
jgi:hypothetical protein